MNETLTHATGASNPRLRRRATHSRAEFAIGIGAIATLIVTPAMGVNSRGVARDAGDDALRRGCARVGGDFISRSRAWCARATRRARRGVATNGWGDSLEISL